MSKRQAQAAQAEVQVEEVKAPTEVITEEMAMVKTKDQLIMEDIIELHIQRKSAAYIDAVLADKYSVPVKHIKLIHKNYVGSKAGGAQGDIAALVRVLRQNHGKVQREELVHLMSRASGYTESTANHMLSQLNFAKEWAKQEIAELAK